MTDAHTTWVVMCAIGACVAYGLGWWRLATLLAVHAVTYALLSAVATVLINDAL